MVVAGLAASAKMKGQKTEDREEMNCDQIEEEEWPKE